MLIFILFVLIVALVAPYIISWRISRLGSAITKTPPQDKTEVAPSFFVNVKGTHGTTRQSMLCKLRFYSDRFGMRLLWGTERFLEYSSIASAERLLSGAKTLGIKFIPKDRSNMQDTTVTGVIDIPKFIDFLKQHGIVTTEVEAKRSLLNVFG